MYPHEILKHILKRIEKENVNSLKLMNQVLYENRCKCNEEMSVTKKRKLTSRSDGKPFLYPTQTEVTIKTFQIRYEKKLSIVAKFLLNSFQNKYLYYAIDDILYLLKLNLAEQENLLSILYSSVLALQNNLSINFFDIWIQEIYINEAKPRNKFLVQNTANSKLISYITIKLLYRTKVPIKKQESLW